MSTPNTIAVYDIEVFEGITYEATMQLVYIDPLTGLPFDPITYVDLTNKEVAVMANGIFNNEVALISGQGQNDFGSICEILDPLTGLFRFKWTATQLTNLDLTDGMWRAEVREAQDADLLVYGHIHATGFTIGGQV